MTDPEIAASPCATSSAATARGRELAAAIGRYLRHLSDAIDESEGYRVMPGIEELLERLVDAGHLLGLTTGNIEAAAHIKLARAGLNRFFSFGGYGSDSSERTELTRMRPAPRRHGLRRHPRPRRPAIAVGDTPRDVVAGHGAGIEVVGVATGNFTVDQLRDAGADWAIADVSAGFPA